MDNPTGIKYFVKYSRNLAGGGRLRLQNVMDEKSLAWYLTNYSERYEYIIESARVATPGEIVRFSRDHNEESGE